MKNEFFGDRRDLFKFDLALWMSSSASGRLTYVPMLTELTRERGNGEYDYQRAKAGYHNAQLLKLLNNCAHGIDGHSQDIREIVPYFQANDIEIATYKDTEYLTRRNRSTYWNGIADTVLPGSLVLVDPDTGMENSNPTEEHLYYAELRHLLAYSSDSSILMVYQHFERVPHEVFLVRRSADFAKFAGVSPIYITDNEIIFFFMSKSADAQSRMNELLSDYHQRYPKLTVGGA